MRGKTAVGVLCMIMLTGTVVMTDQASVLLHGPVSNLIGLILDFVK